MRTNAIKDAPQSAPIKTQQAGGIMPHLAYNKRLLETGDVRTDHLSPFALRCLGLPVFDKVMP